MSVGFRSQGSVGTGSSSVAPGTPAGLATGDGVLLFVVTKAATGTTTTINTPAGWALVAEVFGGGGGSSEGVAVGPTRGAWLFREKDAGWSTVPSVSITNGNSSAALALAYTKGAGTTWSVAGATGVYGSGALTSSGTVALDSNPGITAGDWCVVGYTNQNTSPTWSAQSVSATGISAWGTVTERSEVIETTTGADCGGMVFDVPVTTGTASAAPTTAGTLSTSGCGTASLVRLREVGASSPITITGTQATSTNTAQAGTTKVGTVIAGGMATSANTAQAGAALVEIRRNLATNPTFEASVSGWSIQSGANAPAQSTTRAHTGTTSMLLARGSGSSTLWAFRDLGPTQVSPNTTYTVSAYLWVPSSNADNVSLRVAGADVVSAVEAATTTRDAWARVSVTFTTNATADAVFFYVRGGTNGQVWVDSVMLNVGTDPADYFSGGTPDAAPFYYRWVGTANESQSIQFAAYVAPVTLTGGPATEADAALAGATATGALLTGGQATETDATSAGTVTVHALIDGGLAEETDEAVGGAVIGTTLIEGGQATETDEPFAGITDVSANTTIPGTQALEADDAIGGTLTYSYAVTDTTNRVGGRRRSGYAVATWTPPVAPAPVTLVHGESRDVAQAFGNVTMDGTQPVFDVHTVSRTRHRDRIVVGGKDVTYWRDVPTPLPTYQLVSPLLYGPATLRLPQVSAAFEKVGEGALSWLAPEKNVLIQRVDADTGEVVATDYKGVVVAINDTGPELTVEIGGEASGRAALQERQLPIFRQTTDLGAWAYRAIHQYLGLPFEPRLGPDTGIKLARFGGTGFLDYVSELCARGWTRDGNQWTIAPVNGVYRMFRKDTTTIDATAYIDDARVVADLRRDIAEEPNRIYATGITPDGQRVRFGAYPGLQHSHPAPYPFRNDRNFGVGTTNAETDTGDGVSVMIAKLRVGKYMDANDTPGGYDNDAAKGIRQLQDDAGLPVTGTMTPATWRALFDLDSTGFSLRWSHIAPAAQKSYTRKWITSGSGAMMRRNPNYDPRRLKIDRTIDMGSGFTVQQMREFAQAEKDKAEDNWVGTLTFNTGALVSGNRGHAFTPTEDDMFRARRLKPGMNIRLPHSPGGDIVVHVSACSVAEDGTVTATVDTRARDTMAVWEVIQRNRESRKDPARQWIREHRASGEIKDAVDGWDEVGGLLGDTLTIPGHKWTVFEMVAGQEGTVQALRTRTNPNSEYVMAVFGKRINAKRLERRIGNPLTSEGKDRWSDESVRNDLDHDRFLLYVAGSDDEPLGYYPKTKAGDHPLTGRWEDAAGFSYRTFAQPVIYVAVYADRDTSIPSGRLMWPQLEAGA